MQIGIDRAENFVGFFKENGQKFRVDFFCAGLRQLQNLLRRNELAF